MLRFVFVVPVTVCWCVSVAFLQTLEIFFLGFLELVGGISSLGRSFVRRRLDLWLDPSSICLVVAVEVFSFDISA